MCISVYFLVKICNLLHPLPALYFFRFFAAVGFIKVFLFWSSSFSALAKKTADPNQHVASGRFNQQFKMAVTRLHFFFFALNLYWCNNRLGPVSSTHLQKISRLWFYCVWRQQWSFDQTSRNWSTGLSDTKLFVTACCCVCTSTRRGRAGCSVWKWRQQNKMKVTAECRLLFFLPGGKAGDQGQTRCFIIVLTKILSWKKMTRSVRVGEKKKRGHWIFPWHSKCNMNRRRIETQRFFVGQWNYPLRLMMLNCNNGKHLVQCF